jgi:asparagine synthase (glutamine-hydrolysing)
MTDIMTHRGPDERGTYRADGIALGVRRLSIVDVEGGHQPATNENGNVWAIQNGELYNHNDLRAVLADDGHSFASACDTEVIPHLYERYGSDVATHLRGKFALAVWDEPRRRAVLARDRLGVKPLYYAHVGDVVVFASELKSVLASGLVPADLDYEAIAAYVTLGFFPGPLTPLRGVAKLPPAHTLVVEDGKVRLERYWSLPVPDFPHCGISADEYAERLLAEVEEAVRLRLMSDVPLGAMLSGGLDSSVIVALMARNMTEPVKTFSVGFVEDREANELEDAKLVASALGTDHHALELSFHDQAIALEDLLWHLDEPIADLSALGFYALSRLAAEHVTVALAGQGADELLGGYPAHRNAAVAAGWQHVARPLRSAGAPLAQRLPQRVRRASAAITASDPVTRFMAQGAKVRGPLRERLFRGPLAELPKDAVARLVAERLEPCDDDPLTSTLYLYTKLALVDDFLLYFDKTSMANSLEVRVPFLDHRVVDFCATIPNNLKVHRLTGKYLLKRAARGLIPDRIIDKKKVGFFSTAIGEWFRAQASTATADYLIQPNAAYQEMLSRPVVEQLVSDHVSGSDGSRPDLVLAILMLEIWLSSYLPRALRPSPGLARPLTETA